MPLSLADLMYSTQFSEVYVPSYFRDLFTALVYLHDQGPAKLADFGTAWHPTLSTSNEPANHKILEVGTTCYRAPETLFGNRAYGPSLDMWAAGTMLAECCSVPTKPLFESRDTSEDGNQLGLILSIFKTLGTPTKDSWPEAVHFSTPPFEWYQEFPGHTFESLLAGAKPEAIDLVKGLVSYESGDRLSAEQALKHPYISRI